MKLMLVPVLLAALCHQVVQGQKLFTALEDLTDGNWSEKIKPTEDSLWLIAFYVPWCEHAQAFAPKLEAVADDLRLHKYNINFGAVDVSTNPQLGHYYRIDSSPVIKMLSYMDGIAVIEDYLPEEHDVHEFCKISYRMKNLPYTDVPEGFEDGQIIELDDDNYDSVVSTSNEIWLVMFGAPWCHHCKVTKPALISAAAQLGPKVRVAIVDADKNRGLAKRHKIAKLPTLKFYSAGYGKADETIQLYEGGRTEKEFVEFGNALHAEFMANPEMFEYAHESEVAAVVPPPIHISDFKQSVLPSTLREMCQDGSLCILAFLPRGVYQQNMVNDMAELEKLGESSGVSLFWVEHGQYTDCESTLYLKNDVAQVIAFRYEVDSYQLMHTDFTVSNCQKFIQDIQAEGLKGMPLPEGGITIKSHFFN